jgi:hypothetical protein
VGGEDCSWEGRGRGDLCLDQHCMWSGWDRGGYGAGQPPAWIPGRARPTGGLWARGAALHLPPWAQNVHTFPLSLSPPLLHLLCQGPLLPFILIMDVHIFTFSFCLDCTALILTTSGEALDFSFP